MPPPPETARRVGMALVVSAVALLFLALLFWVDVFDLPSENEGFVSGVLVAAALIDLIVGIRYLSQASAR